VIVETEPTQLNDLPPVIEAWGREYKKGPVIWRDNDEDFWLVVTYTTGDPNDMLSDDDE
jgi:hypothetical protein